jgi:hypothetical protein
MYLITFVIDRGVSLSTIVLLRTRAALCRSSRLLVHRSERSTRSLW